MEICCNMLSKSPKYAEKRSDLDKICVFMDRQVGGILPECIKFGDAGFGGAVNGGSKRGYIWAKNEGGTIEICCNMRSKSPKYAEKRSDLDKICVFMDRQVGGILSGILRFLQILLICTILLPRRYEKT